MSSPHESPDATYTKLAAPMGPAEAASAAMIDEILKDVRSGSGKTSWRDDGPNTRGDDHKNDHTYSQRERNPKDDDRKVLQEITLVDEHDKDKSHVVSQKMLYAPGSETVIGFDTATYRHDKTLATTNQWRGEGKDPKTGETLPNRYHSVEYAADGKTKLRELVVSGNVDTTTSFEADGETPRRIETVVRTDRQNHFVGNRIVQDFEHGSLVKQATSKDELSGQNTRLLTETFSKGVLTDKQYPIADSAGRPALRHESFFNGKLSGWEDSEKTDDGKNVVVSRVAVSHDKITDQIDFNFTVPRLDKAWYQDRTMPLDASMKSIPAGAMAPSYTHTRFDSTTLHYESNKTTNEKGDVLEDPENLVTRGRPIFEETISRGAGGRQLSWKEIGYTKQNVQFIKQQGTRVR